MKKNIWAFILNFLNFNWTLRSNLVAKIRNYGDWTIYNEIFVNNEYDSALNLFFDEYQQRDKTISVLDLGANVGFFSLRFCDIAIQKNIKIDQIHLYLVEADARCLKPLKDHISQLEYLGATVKIFHGLAGKKSGKANIIFGQETFGSKVKSDENSISKKKLLNYIDLTKIISKDQRLDLIKCDIEGSEFDFIDNYEYLIKEVRFLLMEFHEDFGSTQNAISKIKEFGFNEKTIIDKETPYFTTLFYKDISD